MNRSKLDVRAYKRVFSRSVPLVMLEYWYQGEAIALDKFTEGTMFFDPVYYCYKTKDVGVFYDFTSPKQSMSDLATYINSHQKKYAVELKKFEANKTKLVKLLSCPIESRGEVTEVFNIIVGMWPVITTAVLYGNLNEHEFSEESRKLRRESDVYEYKVAMSIIDWAERTHGLKRDRALLMTLKELLAGEDERVDTRKTGFIMIDGGVIDGPIKPDEVFEKYGIELLDRVIVNDIEISVKGMVAYKGVAQGKVVVLRSVEDLERVTKESIIVATMTLPDYMSALRIARGIVTDEGGITCHAAIVARELKKPCIVGTHTATQVFKEGDTIRIDANNGVAERL